MQNLVYPVIGGTNSDDDKLSVKNTTGMISSEKNFLNNLNYLKGKLPSRERVKRVI